MGAVLQLRQESSNALLALFVDVLARNWRTHLANPQAFKANGFEVRVVDRPGEKLGYCGDPVDDTPSTSYSGRLSFCRWPDSHAVAKPSRKVTPAGRFFHQATSNRPESFRVLDERVIQL